MGRGRLACELGGVPHRIGKGEEKARAARTLAQAYPLRTIAVGKTAKIRETAMTGLIETYRVEAYNTSKLSENKIYDDAVARRFGFRRGPRAGVDVMAYMMHVPVSKWGRAFLERGLIGARFVKPVYDGEIAEVTGEENDDVISIEVSSRGELCATGPASLPASAPSFSMSEFPQTAALAERKPVSPTSYEVGQWLGTVPRAWIGEAAAEYFRDGREDDPTFCRERFGDPGV